MVLLRKWKEWWLCCSGRSNSDTGSNNNCDIITKAKNGDHCGSLTNSNVGTASAQALDTTSNYTIFPATITTCISRQQRALLLDIRPNHEYQQRNFSFVSNYYKNSSRKNMDCFTQQLDQEIVYVHIPFTEIVHHKFELPPRQIPFAIVSSFLEEDWLMHWNSIQAMLSSSPSSPSDHPHQKKRAVTVATSLEHIHKRNVTTVPSHLSWKVIALFNANDETIWESAREQIGPHLGYNDACAGQATYPIPLPLPRLWSPDPMIEETLLPLLKEKLQSTGQQHGVMETWDIRSGLGRVSVSVDLAEDTSEDAPVDVPVDDTQVVLEGN
jgi:hypothetical protein